MVDRLLRAAEGPSLVEKRDAALLWFLVLMGARVTETIRIVRDKPSASELQRTPGWFDGRALPPSVELIRKGGFHQRLPYPPYALRALHAFQAELEKHAPPLGSQSDNPNAALYVRPDSSAWRYKLLATKPDAPLFPPVSFWGLNSPGNYRELRPNGLDYRKPMNRSAVTAILRRIADKAGFSAEEKLAVHGHAFRHFAATAMSRQGKPIRETQQILGHASIVTTETYVEDITSPEALSAQNEILDYIAGGERPRGAPAPEPRRPIVETHGIAVPAPAPEPETSEVGLPAEAPKVKALPEIQKTAKGLVALAPKAVPPEVLEVEHGISSGSPYYAYEGADQLHFTMVEPRSGAKRETLYTKGSKEYVQREPWLREHYDPWPLSYGIGENSLLPWFARGAASSSGEVKVEVRTKDGKKVVTVPPLPVFAGEQLYSEAKAPTLWKRVLELRERWLRTAPTKAFGLDRWWGAFQEIQRGLARGTGGAFPVVPFDALGTVGTNIRAHDEEYLAAWLEKNADRYTTTVRAFEGIERPRGGSLTDEEWLSFQEKFAAASLIGVSPAEELPDWFMLDDPVRDIYDHSSEEWEWFEKWIGAVTGQRLTPARDAERARDAAFASTAIETRIEEARELLAAYFESVEDLKNQPKGEDADREREVIRLLRDRLLALGVPDPGATKGLARDLKARIEELIALGFPSADVELVDPNVLRSALFDKDTFRIDTSKKTISHTPEFQKDFAERYDGRDSECVARRAARGMWEHVKRHGIPVKRGAERSSEYSLLYSVMLSYLSWIVPCPEAIEERMGKERSARMRYLTGFRRASARVLRTGDVDEPGLRRIAVE
ncbi:MAG: site-specific integrase, partial [Elusimicrobia bacterium]|nr:site-specific integrase [Elusimicrobiota bacterium]